MIAGRQNEPETARWWSTRFIPLNRIPIVGSNLKFKEWRWQTKELSFGSHLLKVLFEQVRFPSGLRAFSNYAHERNMSLGLYTSQTELTCQVRPGSYRHEAADAKKAVKP